MVPEVNLVTVGDCVALVKGGMDAELDPVDCGTPEARYTVAHDVKLIDGCPDGPYVEYSAVGFGGWTLCLMLNTAVGECFTNDVVDGFTPVDCAAGNFRVTAVLPDTADTAGCPPQQLSTVLGPALVYPEPPRTICVDGIG